MSSEDRWADEEAFWTMGAAEARRRIHPACVMVVGNRFVQGDDILAELDAGPRRGSVGISDRHVVMTEDCVVLAYRAASVRDGAEEVAFCSSTWVWQSDGWHLIHHHRTDAAD